MNKLDVWVDGACEPVNPGGTATYGLIVKLEGTVLLSQYAIVGKGELMSNNVAEYSALLAFLNWYKKHSRNEAVSIYSDSQLLVNQMSDKWKANSGLYLPFYDQCKAILETNSPMFIVFNWIPREQNQEADRLSKMALKISV